MRFRAFETRGVQHKTVRIARSICWHLFTVYKHVNACDGGNIEQFVRQRFVIIKLIGLCVNKNFRIDYTLFLNPFSGFIVGLFHTYMRGDICLFFLSFEYSQFHRDGKTIEPYYSLKSFEKRILFEKIDVAIKEEKN